jgi:thiamine pyrophosphate-dependent acetolactate synthase large subunit-like protein
LAARPIPKLYEAPAEAFLAEGVDTQFVLMGDGNMHWSTAFAKLPGVQSVHVRHEHATVAAATAYNVATSKVAVASVTCGPGVTQLMTACRPRRDSDRGAFASRYSAVSRWSK